RGRAGTRCGLPGVSGPATGGTMLQSPRGGSRRERALLASAVAVLGAAGVIAQAAVASPVTPPAVPDSIAVPAGNVAYLVGHATGTQNYTCQSNGTWPSSSTPDAILTGQNEHVFVAHHFPSGVTPPGAAVPLPEW